MFQAGYIFSLAVTLRNTLEHYQQFTGNGAEREEKPRGGVLWLTTIAGSLRLEVRFD